MLELWRALSRELTIIIIHIKFIPAYVATKSKHLYLFPDCSRDSRCHSAGVHLHSLTGCSTFQPSQSLHSLSWLHLTPLSLKFIEQGGDAAFFFYQGDPRAKLSKSNACRIKTTIRVIGLKTSAANEDIFRTLD